VIALVSCRDKRTAFSVEPSREDVGLLHVRVAYLVVCWMDVSVRIICISSLVDRASAANLSVLGAVVQGFRIEIV